MGALFSACTHACRSLVRTLLCRVWFRRCLGWLPNWLYAPVMRWLQTQLRDQLECIFTSLPPTGLHDASLPRFQHYCRHLVCELATSPRSMHLRSADAVIASRLVHGDADVQELVQLLELAHQQSPPSLLTLIDAIEATTPGAEFALHARHASNAAKLLAPELIERIRDGMIRKRGAVGADEAVCAIVAANAASCERERECANSLWPRVEADCEYKVYRRVHALWQSTGLQALATEYAELDRTVGAERVTRGSSFESHRSSVVFELVRQRLALDASVDVQLERNCMWLDAHAKPAGEIDLAIVVDECVRGLVEIKANCWELPSALLHQHASKLADASMSIVTSGANGAARRLAFSPHKTRTFVVTLIPDFEYRLGAPPEVVQRLCQCLWPPHASLTPRTDAAVLGIIDDSATAASYMDAVRAAVAPAVYAPPADVLSARSDDVIVLLP